ncbi:MAG: hypothetical protein ABSC08_05880 [Bryobacteraceae bacterium]
MVSLLKRLVVIAAVVIVGLSAQSPLATNNSGHDRACELAGTWYGGSDMTVPYQFTAIPMGDGRHSMRFQQAIDYLSLGFLWVTDWTGEAVRVRGQKYRVHAVAFYVNGPVNAQQLGGSLEMDGVISTMEFSDDCNTITNTIDTFIGYIPWTEEKEPFVTDPDYNWLEVIGIETLVETYHRMPTAGLNGPFASHANNLLRPDGTKLRGKKR